MNRAPFNSELTLLRSELKSLLPLLESSSPDRHWYGSIYFERRTQRSFNVNLKGTNVGNSVTQGAVFRIYDGYTLFEQASDDLDLASLRRTAEELVKRVSAAPVPENAKLRPYRAPSWKERLSVQLEPEITSQIPAGAGPETRVHFGIRYVDDPTRPSTESRMSVLKALVERITVLSAEEGFAPTELSFATARQGFSTEESIFIDRETDMSQTLYRLSLTVVAMSGSDRVFSRLGGLGGLETIAFTDDEIRKLLRELKALRTAERLVPGRYRVLFSPVISGILAHEAFGHGQEGDTCARGRSKAWDLHKSGESVGNSHATILNNPAAFTNGADPYAAWGSYFFDEEGWLAQEQVILDKGRLKAPMTNLTSAIRLGIPRTANGKRENWSQGVYTRQTNTYFSAGTMTLNQLMELLGDGYIATEPAGGMEDPKGMGIQVGIHYLLEVKGGKKTGRIFRGPAGGDIQMTGYTPDVLNAIVAKSKIEAESGAPDQSRHPTNDVGGCGKYHKEFVNAGCGGPWMLLDPVMLG